MSRTKRLLKHPITQALLARLLAGYIGFVYFTSRKYFEYEAESVPYMQGEHNAIFTFWHGRMMLCPLICPPKRQMRVLISMHRDGLLISSVIARFNQKTVSGSTSRGGKAAVIEMLKALKKGDNISITPDGPRGPFQEAALGAVTLARLSGKPLLPVTFSSSHAKRLRSWDRFMLAYPFGRVVFCVGAPLMIQNTTDEQALNDRQRFEEAMNSLVEKADRFLNP